MSAKKVDVKALQKTAIELRKGILQVVNSAKSGHPGGSLSAVEIFISLYGCKMNHRPEDPNWEDRDRLIISKGHASPAAYVTLSHFGYFPKEELVTFRKLGARLQGHVHRKVPGVELNTGSLGHGLSVANGMALGARMRKKDFKAYCLMGDGEIQEGSVWEAAMTAAHFKLDNVCAIVDYNKIQENGLISDIMGLEPLAEKWKSFGWEVVSVDGHNLDELIKALDRFGTIKGKPMVIIANTVKGKGISFMENTCKWHGKAPNDEQLKEALSELE